MEHPNRSPNLRRDFREVLPSFKQLAAKARAAVALTAAALTVFGSGVGAFWILGDAVRIIGFTGIQAIIGEAFAIIAVSVLTPVVAITSGVIATRAIELSRQVCTEFKDWVQDLSRVMGIGIPEVAQDRERLERAVRRAIQPLTKEANGPVLKPLIADGNGPPLRADEVIHKLESWFAERSNSADRFDYEQPQSLYPEDVAPLGYVPSTDVPDKDVYNAGYQPETGNPGRVNHQDNDGLLI